MSRSYRKNCIFKGGRLYKDVKKTFNRRLRRSNKTQDIPDGNKYRRLNEQWDIVDFEIGYYSYSDFYKHNREFFDTDEECYKHWRKEFQAK